MLYSVHDKARTKDILSELNTGSPIYAVYKKVNGETIVLYHQNLIRLLDRVFSFNCMNRLSLEQQRYMNRYFHLADEVLSKLAENKPSNVREKYSLEMIEQAVELMDDNYIQLDLFLGNWKGDKDYGRYIKAKCSSK